ncbi:hypothetical protein PG987_006149 [Apiospora arundinis]
MAVIGILFTIWAALGLAGHRIVSAAAVTQASGVGNRTEFLPRGLSVGEVLSVETTPLQGGGFTLNSTAPLATLDYGTEVAGIPFFSISAVKPGQNQSSVQVEVRYSEAYLPLAHPWADGPYTFSVSLANGFRVETFNTTCLPRFSATTRNSTTYGASAPRRRPPPASKKGTQPAVWEVDPVKGVLLRSQKPAVWAHGFALANYTMEFETMIERGGVWWTVAMPNGGYGSYLQLRLVGELPEASTFANVNRTIAPPNSILVSYGYDFVNQTTLPSLLLDTFPIANPVAEKRWHRVKTVLSPSGHLAVSLNGQEVFNISISDYYTAGKAVSFTGSFGVGAWQDEVAYVRNLTITDTINGSGLYTHPLTTEDILVEFGTQSNIKSVCLNGPKRDRLVWLGDFYHTARVVGSSTARFDMARGTLEIMLGTQNEYGMLAINTPMGYEPATSAPIGSVGGLEDYQLLGASSMYGYIRYTNDLDFLRATWPKWQKQLGWLESRIDDTDGLVHLTSEFLATGATAPTSSGSCATVQVLREFAELAEAIDESAAATKYTTLADGMVKAIQERLWNNELGVFSAAVNDRSNFSVPATAFCITSGVATTEQANRSISALQSQLALGVGYKDSSKVNSSEETQISPNTNGFLLDALFRAGAYSTGHNLLRSLWGAMINNPETSSGASWEYLLPDGRPGLDRFTSLAHPWGGAPTYVLTEWAAGLQPVSGPDGFGYRKWVLNPEAGLAMGLKRAVGRVQTPTGPLSVQWDIAEGTAEMRVVVETPTNTMGTPPWRLLQRRSFTLRVTPPRLCVGCGAGQRQRRQITTSSRDAADQMMRTFANRVTTRRQVLNGNQLQKLSLTLGRPHLYPGLDVTESPPPEGTPLPPGYHLVYFTPGGLESELGSDGTDKTFNAPSPFTRRMWAGGRMSWKTPAQLLVGKQAEERTRLLSATPKKSRDGGEMVLVEVEKEFWGPDGLALVDQRSWIFRPEVPAAHTSASHPVEDTTVRGPSTVEDVNSGKGSYPCRRLRWSPVGLFRFSALTFNGHKIHYDGSWTRSVENHPGCVVHGPLNLISMLDYWRDVCAGGPVGAISYRAISPLYTGEMYQISTQDPIESADEKSWDMLVHKGDVVCMKGTITKLNA